MKKFFEVTAMILIIWGLFMLGYFCGFADTLGLHKYINVPEFHEVQHGNELEPEPPRVYKKGNVIIRRYKNHEDYNRDTIDNYDDRREWM